MSDAITFSSLDDYEVYTGKFSDDRSSFIVVDGEESVEFVKQTSRQNKAALPIPYPQWIESELALAQRVAGL